MKIALIGYGKMGKTIEQIALQRNHQIYAIADKESDFPALVDADCCIEFTQPNAAARNLNFCVENNIPVVCGTTAWYQHYESVKQHFLNNNGALITATNFSIGVNVFFKLNEVLAEMMQKIGHYIPEMEEVHHLQKLDHPSGTATTLAQGIFKNFPSYNTLKAYLEGEVKPPNMANVLNVLCKRASEVPGTHTVKYTSAIDEIEITHTAKSREGFATGAVVAAEWLQNKKGVYTMKDVLGI